MDERARCEIIKLDIMQAKTIENTTVLLAFISSPPEACSKGAEGGLLEHISCRSGSREPNGRKAAPRGHARTGRIMTTEPATQRRPALMDHPVSHMRAERNLPQHQNLAR